MEQGDHNLGIVFILATKVNCMALPAERNVCAVFQHGIEVRKDILILVTVCVLPGNTAQVSRNNLYWWLDALAVNLNL